MKVIKKGRHQNGFALEETCTGHGNGGGGCGALLLVEKSDMYKTYKHYRDETDVFVTFTCPECEVETNFEYGKVSYKIQDELLDKKYHKVNLK